MYEHIIYLNAHIDMTGLDNATKFELIKNISSLCEGYKVKLEIDLPQLGNTASFVLKVKDENGNIKTTSLSNGAVDSISKSPT